MTTATSLPARLRARRTRRFALRDDLAGRDTADFETIVRELVTREFPWGNTQALSFALFRTYAVPSIGDLLCDTGEFTERTQKRYDDTVLLLDAPIEHGVSSTLGRTGIRRINEMHGMYDIPNDDLLYVLATFVVCPVEWINTYEWRTLSDAEVIALTDYYRLLGKRMGIKGIPETYAGFATLLDEYETAHFAYSPKAVAVADATLDLLGTFPPFHLLPRAAVRRISFALMDDRLRAAFHYPTPSRVERAVVRGGLKARGLAIRLLFPPRREPMFGRQTPQVRCYPNGYRVEELGTFTPGCPVPHV
ncbi:DUF2236 domain-containing protein [Gordonia amarae]|uniref:ER-bound oxygenase mpaB/mpaB'/Rubber oxygenase catalytic domain-containing protein n=2 Tax=Gordonia amarae TaxID=36821 RepID=G7GQV6_9ACTN|nr:oxygenase MpaB family protein [Gordonia amarae]MCS3877600.1 hypothetical protein [Gordonia amarae]QHN16316.1 DUF2236 domain-containing protein [Gordonia amarae]QHN20885.1 DUF2236 domain-containing protein [Gordonia amarae]QHN29736.1 DUF2236 domain-containing protein [Gordonia amarae]QHN38511.1 DUF2236 domain-containing protein [Gordonia amarae]